MTGADHGYTHSGGGVMASAGVAPGSGRPVPSNRLIARTVMSWSHRIWHDSRTPVRPRSLRRSFSAAVIVEGSPSTNSTRHVVQRALPPQACMMSTPASCSTASTNRFCAGTSNVPYPSTVSWDMCIFYGTTPHRCQCRTSRPRGRRTRSDLPWFPHEAWRRTQPTALGASRHSRRGCGVTARYTALGVRQSANTETSASSIVSWSSNAPPNTQMSVRCCHSPVPLPMLSTGTSSLCSSVRYRFISGVWSAYRMWRPPWSRPAPPPAKKIGRCWML